LVADDHPMLREGIAAVAAPHTDIVLVGEAANGAEAVERYRELLPDVLLVDLKMPVMGGIEVIAEIRREFPDARIVVLTTYTGDMQAMRALKAGAAGYLLKSTLATSLIETIRLVHAGRRVVLPEVAAEIAEHAADPALTEREMEILREVTTGASNKRIAKRLSISEGTVKAHVKSILEKLRASHRTQAASIALRRGIMQI
jgi:DNA-binding NarL/FixJ family response regulator